MEDPNEAKIIFRMVVIPEGCFPDHHRYQRKRRIDGRRENDGNFYCSFNPVQRLLHDMASQFPDLNLSDPFVFVFISINILLLMLSIAHLTLSFRSVFSLYIRFVIYQSEMST